MRSLGIYVAYVPKIPGNTMGGGCPALVYDRGLCALLAWISCSHRRARARPKTNDGANVRTYHGERERTSPRHGHCSTANLVGLLRTARGMTRRAMQVKDEPSRCRFNQKFVRRARFTCPIASTSGLSVVWEMRQASDSIVDRPWDSRFQEICAGTVYRNSETYDDICSLREHLITEWYV
jgi:hypothetical protein